MAPRAPQRTVRVVRLDRVNGRSDLVGYFGDTSPTASRPSTPRKGADAPFRLVLNPEKLGNVPPLDSLEGEGRSQVNDTEYSSPVEPGYSAAGWWRDSGEVAERMVELALSEPAGRVEDVGGPEVKTVGDLVRSYLKVMGSRKRMVAFRLPGKTARYPERSADVPGEQVR